MSNKSIKQEITQVEELKELEQELKSVDPDIFKGLKPKKKQELLESVSITMIRQKMHSGPLPDPETLNQYNDTIPNGAERIMAMAEKQQGHRFDMEKKYLKSNSYQSKAGQVFGFLIGICGIGSGTYLASIGEPTLGGIIAGGTVVSLVSIFVIGRKRQGNDD